jgi:hypothetical protein
MFEQLKQSHLNPASADRARHFQRFVFHVRRPNSMGWCRILAFAQGQPGDDVPAQACLLNGGQTTENAELSELLPQRDGQGDAQRLIQRWDVMFVATRARVQ